MTTRRRKIRRRSPLSRPRGGLNFGVHYDNEAFGRFSEGIARFLGTARYLVFQTVVVVVWVLFNTLAPAHLRIDPFPYIFLTLILSLQASYAAPLILLAQNRQAERERVQIEHDRRTFERTQNEAEFLAREIASVRIQLADSVTTEHLDRAVERISDTIERQVHQQDYAEEDAGARETR